MEVFRMSKLAATMGLGVALLAAAAPVTSSAAPASGDMPGPASSPRAATAASQKDKDKKQANWLTSFSNATGQARKDDRLIMAYFRGSDWCDFTKKLDRDVLSTDLFIDWAAKNVILLDVDLPAEKRQSPSQKKHNEALKDKYSVVKTPTFVFLDADGEPITRTGFDTAKLRDNEPKGQPKAFIEYLDGVVKNRPKKQQVIAQKNFDDGLRAAKEHGLPLLVLLTQGESEETSQVARDLMANQKFVRFVNTHMAFVRVAWPKEDDSSLESLEFLAWAHRQKVPPLLLQLVVWDPHQRKVTARVTGIDPVKVEPVLLRLRDVLPKIDYTGRWLEDFRLAQAIAAQLDREILMAFTSLDSSEWSQRLDKEIFQQEQFKEYARRNLVLLRIDFPRTAKQPEKIAEQNRLLAEAHGVRGYPTVIFINPRGQKFGEAKYMKGGPEAFIQSLDQLRKADYDRRTILSDQFKPDAIQ
jgi:thioredoxin-related protein